MPDETDWSLTTFEGLRRRQNQEFRALPLREKLRCLEEMSELVEYFAAKSAERRGRRAAGPTPSSPDRPASR